MGQSLKEIAETLKNANNKVQLIYAFNGTGKTRLSREFRQLVAPKNPDGEEDSLKILYYNAYTEDLFYWDNDLKADVNRKLLIRPNGFTNMVLYFLKDQGLDGNITTNFQHYTSDKLTPTFNQEHIKEDEKGIKTTVKAYSEITFSIQSGNEEIIPNVKISKAEESNFIWCVFYSLLEQIIEILNVPDPFDKADNQFDNLKYVFIDDPVSSLDENHLIELAVNLATVIKKSNTSDLKFIISTHNPLFYNVLYTEFNNKICYLLKKLDDGTYELHKKDGASNKSFSYHLFLKKTIEDAITNNTIQKYHFTLLRNLYEKTSHFLGYTEWKNLLPDDRELYYYKIIQFTSHSTLSNEVVAEPTIQEKETLKLLFNYLISTYKYSQ